MISVIIPVYKAEPHLRRCVDSVLAQTYRDFELILVDDGSPDNCGVMCDEYGKKDRRVRVLHKENGGVSAARNAGLDAAEGKFISFVDSDDWLHPQMLELLMKAVEESDADAVTISNIWVKDEYVTPVKYDYDQISKRVLSGTIIKERMYDCLYEHSMRGFLSCGLWGMYCAAAYDGVRFDENIANNEDMEIALRLNLGVNRVVHMDVPLYYYYTGNESATRTALNSNQLTMLRAWKKMGESTAISDVDADKFYYMYIWQFFDYEHRVSLGAEKRLIEAFRKYDMEFRESKERIYNNRLLSLREKMMIWLYLHNRKEHRLFFGKYERYMLDKINGFGEPI